MYVSKNIDVVQVNIKQGVNEYYLPKNVNWHKQSIDKIVISTSPNEDLTVLSPIDGETNLLSPADIADLYLDLYDGDCNLIARNLAATNVLDVNNYITPINRTLSLNLSRLFFTSSPVKDGCLFVYVYYGGKVVEEPELAKRSITVKVPLKANAKTSLQDIVDNYIYMQPANVKGIYLWEWKTKPVYLTLRYADNVHVFNNILSSLCRPPLYDAIGGAGGASHAPASVSISYPYTQLNPMLMDNIADIDMLNSFVQNAQNEDIEVKLTFLY